MADRWLIQFGKDETSLEIVGKGSTRGQAVEVAQLHFDKATSGAVRSLPIDPENPAGDYPCAHGHYRITRLGSGKWRAVP